MLTDLDIRSDYRTTFRSFKEAHTSLARPPAGSHSSWTCCARTASSGIHDIYLAAAVVTIARRALAALYCDWRHSQPPLSLLRQPEVESSDERRQCWSWSHPKWKFACFLFSFSRRAFINKSLAKASISRVALDDCCQSALPGSTPGEVQERFRSMNARSLRLTNARCIPDLSNTCKILPNVRFWGC